MLVIVVMLLRRLLPLVLVVGVYVRGSLVHKLVHGVPFVSDEHRYRCGVRWEGGREVERERERGWKTENG